VLPLLRRTFGAFASGERRAISERVAGDRAARGAPDATVLDHDRAAAVLPALRLLLGREVHARERDDSVRGVAPSVRAEAARAGGPAAEAARTGEPSSTPSARTHAEEAR
jgi:hypothetical protein